MTSSNLDGHLRDCAECRSQQSEVERLAALLAPCNPAVDAVSLSQRALPGLLPSLDANFARATRKRAWSAVLISLAPLALILGYDLFVLNLLQGFLLRFLPSSLVTYLVSSYLAFMVLLFSATYASIPVLVAHRRGPAMRRVGRAT